jgi:predicted RNA binding protein YcfA (HicA-like mRNA interferase family)
MSWVCCTILVSYDKQYFKSHHPIAVSKKQKLLQQILKHQKNVSFQDLVSLIEAFGFTLSGVNGSHHIFTHPNIPELMNIQNVKGKAKPYQVRQFLALIETYNLTLEN